jgi:hypothetical protein
MLAHASSDMFCACRDFGISQSSLITNVRLLPGSFPLSLCRTKLSSSSVMYILWVFWCITSMYLLVMGVREHVVLDLV